MAGVFSSVCTRFGWMASRRRAAMAPSACRFACKHRAVVIGIGDKDTAEPPLQICKAVGQAEDSHDFGGHGDDEAVLARHTVHFAAQAHHDIAQRAIVHVKTALDEHTARINPKRVALLEVIVRSARLYCWQK